VMVIRFCPPLYAFVRTTARVWSGSHASAACPSSSRPDVVLFVPIISLKKPLPCSLTSIDTHPRTRQGGRRAPPREMDHKKIEVGDKYDWELKVYAADSNSI
jgi:hypothetical protein